MKKNLYVVLAVLLMMHASVGLAGVADTKHNLSSGGPGTYKSATETEVCKFCHTPHTAMDDGPLWNHKNDQTSFTKFSSATLFVDDDAGDKYDYKAGVKGSSLLCMGCHDGVTALGALANENIVVGPSDYLTATDLRNKHPVSFIYDGTTVSDLNTAKGSNIYGLPGVIENSTIKNDFVAEKVRREDGGRAECTICHDPHTNNATDNVSSLPFWVSSSIGTEDSHDSVCKACHSAFQQYSFFGEYSSL